MIARKLNRQAGSTMVLVMVILVSLLAGAGITLYLQLQQTRGISLVKKKRYSLYCAEAGLAAARLPLGEAYALWPTLLDPGATKPSWYPLEGDLDDPPDGEMDYRVAIMDNDDELPPLDNDPTVDNDLKVFLVSKCNKYPDAPRAVLELVTYEGGGALYRDQDCQGSGCTGNAN